MTIHLHQQQQDAIDKVNDWLARGCPMGCFRLFGVAGTGKSTLAKLFPKIVNGKVLYASYTGKAAHVLTKKGCPATTIHRLIYSPKVSSEKYLESLETHLTEAQRMKDGKRVRKLKQLIEAEKARLRSPKFERRMDSELREASLLVLDEVSMVSDKIAHDLVSFGTPILTLGDPAQLPPVGGAGGFFTNAQPDVMLTEIHRQESGSEILDLAALARNKEQLPFGDCVVPKGSRTIEDLAQYDQILVGRNRTRRTINTQMRRHLGLDGLPKPGDKLVCLRNNHDLGIMNGSQWSVVESCPVEGDQIILKLVDDDGFEVNVISWTHLFEGREAPAFGSRECELFDYGYAMTAHKAQGSQWPSVFIVDESNVFRQNKYRWLYTAITRASEKVMVSR